VILKNDDTLITVNHLTEDVAFGSKATTYTIREGESIVRLYNEIVAGANETSDILLLSDNIKQHDGFYENMKSCLYAAEKHAIVNGQEIIDSKNQINAARKYLPDYSITIHTNAGCVLIKRAVINTLGFLDEAYSSLQYALMDFYCRVNKFGFSSIISHHALFSYKERVEELECNADKELFASRYMYWAQKEQRYALHGTHPCVEFLNLIDSEHYPKKRILFDCVIMPPWDCGTSEFQISVFDSFSRLYKDKYDIFLLTNREADEYHKLSEKYENIYYPDTISGTFHLGFAPNQLMLFGPQLFMNKRCLKIIQTMLDVVMVRIDEHMLIDLNSDAELGIKASDGIVFISNNTKHDFLACFSNESSVKGKKTKVIYPATGLGAPVKDGYKLPFEEYFLIVGNNFKHKAITETIEAVSSSKLNFIVIGNKNKDISYPNIYSYEGGQLDDDFLSFLYTNCRAVIFPSLYEGFGLPIVISLKKNKRVVVYDNALNRELFEHFTQFKDYFLFFDKFEQIADIIEDIDFSSALSSIEYDDTWERVAGELESFFAQILEADVCPDKLNQRWHLYRLTEAKAKSDELLPESKKAELTSLHHQFGSYKLTSMLRFALKEHVKNRHIKLFTFIKRGFGKK
jgi:hypothetical protein